MEKIFAEMKQQATIDKAMFESMSTALRHGMDFSFNRHDMADLLDRLREDHIEHLCPTSAQGE